MAWLLTWFGTFVCYDRVIHRLVHLPWDQIDGMTAPVQLSVTRGVDRQASGAVLEVAGSDPGLGPGPALHQPVALVPRDPAGSPRIVALRAGERYLCANRYGEIVADREAASDWEHFLLVEPEEVEDLCRLLDHDWVLHRNDAIVAPADIALLEGFRLAFGPLLLQLPQILPLVHVERFDGPGRPGFYQADLFIDGWKFERISLYRPLIYYTAFARDDIFAQLQLSLESLLAFGRYDGEVLIMADRPPAEVRRYVPAALHPRLHVMRVRVPRGLDYMMARYRVAEWGPAAGYQPLLYTDTDVVFDAPVRPMLAALAHHRLICAPQEQTRVADSPQLGRVQLEADGIAAGDRLGFNAGTQGVANLTVQGGSLRLIYDALTRFARAQAALGAPLVWEDQPMANYVAMKTGCVDTALLSRCMRFDHPVYRQGPVTSPAGRRGMVHFWGPQTYQEKNDKMQAYIQALHAAAEAEPAPD